MAAETVFDVRARAKNGRLVESQVTAASEAEVAERLRAQQMTPISIDAANTGMKTEIKFGKGKVKLKDLSVFSRQFATMLNSGLPMLRSLQILADQSENPRLREILKAIKSDVEQGASLSEALVKHEEFPDLMVNMVKAGEVGGFLDETMVQIADTFEADVKLKSKIKSAMTYPVAVGVIAVLITIGMLLFIVPVFSGMFASLGGELPLPTQIMVDASNALKNPLFFIPVIGLSIGGSIWWKKNKRNTKVREFIDPLKFKAPVFGNLFKKVAIARFARNFSTLLSSGVPILQALDIVGGTAGNIVIEKAVKQVQESVKQGESIAKPLAQSEVFPQMVVQMMAVGEDTGALDIMLRKIADFYDQEVEAMTEQLMALMEPIMIMVLGSLVGGMIVAMYMPIFKIFTLIG
jgi:type IV pilus assembly protein PilC